MTSQQQDVQNAKTRSAKREEFFKKLIKKLPVKEKGYGQIHRILAAHAG